MTPANYDSVRAGANGIAAGKGIVLKDHNAFVNDIVATAISHRASDIHLHAGKTPVIRVDGVLRNLNQFPALSAEGMEQFARVVLRAHQWDALQRDHQVDSSIGVHGGGRLRVNTFYRLGTIGMAMRIVQTQVPPPRELGLPEFVEKLAHLERGLVILTGATGSGKSTTIASLLNETNHHYHKHVITIEDPVEYLFTEDQCIISQREVGIDAPSFGKAMTAALREDPDVILLGEMRDQESMSNALTAAETGHLVFTTLHSPATADVITRITAEYPAEAQPTIRAKLSQNLRAVIAQRLLPARVGEGRVLACEVLTVSARVRELILDPLRVKDIGDLLKKSAIVEGMLSFDEHLLQLCRSGRISEQIALRHASSATDLRLRLQGFAA